MERVNIKFLNRMMYLAGLFLLIAFLNYTGLTTKIEELLVGLVPFTLAFILSWLLRPLGRIISEKTKLKRNISNIIAIFISIIAILFVLLVILPLTLIQMQDLFAQLPTIASNIYDTIMQVVTRLGIDQEVIDDLLTKFSESGLYGSFWEALYNLISNLVNIVAGVTHLIIQVVFAYIISFYLINDFGHINRGIIKFVTKEKESLYITRAYETSNAVFGYINGTFFVCVTVFIFITAGTWLLGLPTPWLFGLIAALFNVIPYLGPYLAAIPIMVVGLSIDPMTSLLCLVLVMANQFIEAYFLQPKIMSRSTKLHPVTIMLGLIIGEALFGIFGMMIATPFMVLFAKLIYYKWDIKL